LRGGGDDLDRESSASGQREGSTGRSEEARRQRRTQQLRSTADGRARSGGGKERRSLCLATLKKSKAVGLDGIPCEAFQSSDEAKEGLFALVTQIWVQEHVPKDITKSEMIPFFKNKGSSNDFLTYRMIGLINHAMKMISTILLFYLLRETTGFIPESQSGFRSGRSTRNAIYIMARLIDHCLTTDTGPEVESQDTQDMRKEAEIGDNFITVSGGVPDNDHIGNLTSDDTTVKKIASGDDRSGNLTYEAGEKLVRSPAEIRSGKWG
jgi:hypothetical protein